MKTLIILLAIPILIYWHVQLFNESQPYRVGLSRLVACTSEEDPQMIKVSNLPVKDAQRFVDAINRHRLHCRKIVKATLFPRDIYSTTYILPKDVTEISVN